MEYTMDQLLPLVSFRGRTVYDHNKKAMFFNWTCTGFRCRFRGTWLKARLIGVCGHVESEEHPYLGITMDDSGELTGRIRLEEGTESYLLAQNPCVQEHTVQVWKLTENARGKCGLVALETDGQLLCPEPENSALRMEVIGDSITCGYGIEAAGRDEPFRPEEENGYSSYWMEAARLLGAQARAVSVSGISVALDPQGFQMPGMVGMEDLLEYTDAMYETEHPSEWDFSANKVDAVVVNLGTNDVNAYKVAKDLNGARAFFAAHYRALLETLRRRCGQETYLLCTLGPLDYYLYDEIRDIVSDYRNQTGDRRVSCFKFGPVVQWSEQYGAVGHPSAKTQERMGRELAAELKKCLNLKVEL